MDHLTRSLVSVIIPTWRRTDQLRLALNHLLACRPLPGEILIHVDAGDSVTPVMLAAEFSNRVSWITSLKNQGPGGGRNLLVPQASFPLIASFDDDSWPIDIDFFHIAQTLMQHNPQAAVLAGQVTLRDQPVLPPQGTITEVNCFENCASVFRKDAFLKTGKYLPLRYAYGMEEADVALQLMDAGWTILKAPQLRVYHDSELQHHASPEINAAHITNTALLAFLRYPVSYWPLGLAQVGNRIRYALSVGRRRGIMAGVLGIPRAIRTYAQARQPVKKETILRSRQLTRT